MEKTKKQACLEADEKKVREDPMIPWCFWLETPGFVCQKETKTSGV